MRLAERGSPCTFNSVSWSYTLSNVNMAWKTFLLLTTVLVQLSGGEDLYWAYNTNWNEPSNWALKRVPCGGDTVRLPNNAITTVTEDITVGTILLPEDGELILQPSVTIRLSEDQECKVPADTEPMAADVKENEFLAPRRWWECGSNWLTKDRTLAEHPPCGDDNAVFEMGSTFFVAANESITVRSITVRGTTIASAKEQLDQREFNLSISIEPRCGETPLLCPCPSDAGCPKAPTLPPSSKPQSPTLPPISKPLGPKRHTVGVAVGIVVVLALAALIVILVVIAIVVYVRRRRSGGYRKDELLEDQLGTGDDITSEARSNPKKEKNSVANMSAFDNPVYESNTLTPGEVEMIGYETKPEIPDDDKQLLKPDLNDYQLTGEMLKPNDEFDLNTYDPQDVYHDDGEATALYEYEKL